MAYTLHNATIASTYDRLFTRNSTVPSTGTTTTGLVAMNDSGVDIVLPLYISTQRVGIGTAAPNTLLDVRGGDGVEGGLTLGTTDTSVVDGQSIGSIYFTGDDGAAINTVGAKIQVAAENNAWASGDSPCYMRFYTSPAGGTLAERMKIDSTGFVGIGTGAPASALHVVSADNPVVARFVSSNTTAADYNCLRQQGYETDDSNDIVYCDWFFDPTTEKYGFGEGTASANLPGGETGDGASLANADIVVDAGKVGIGTATPITVLHVQGADNAVPQIALTRHDSSGIANNDVFGEILFSGSENNTSYGFSAKIQARSAESSNWVEGSAEGTDLEFYTTDIGSATKDLRLTIKEDGDFVGSSSAGISDGRLKTNITSLTSSLDKINSLRGVSFTWKPEAHKNTTKVYLGLIAQEVEEHFPDVVRNESVRDIIAKNAVEAVEARDAVLDGDGNVLEEAIEAVEAQDAIEGESYKSLHYTGLIAPMIKAIQELSAKVTALENA